MAEMTYAQALNQALDLALESDQKVLMLGEDIGHHGGVFGVTRGLIEKYGPKRIIDTPISESGFLGAAVGAATVGYRPVVELMWVDFALVAMDPIVNHAAKTSYMSGGRVKVPMVVRTQQGAGRGNGAQHSQSLEAMFAQVPGLKVVAPFEPADAKGLLTTAIEDGGPVIFLEHKLLYTRKGEVPEGRHALPFGVASVRRQGKDVTIVALSRMVQFADQAADQLTEVGLEAEVIDLRTLVPMDMDTLIGSLARTGRMVLVQEANRSFGWAAEVSARLMESGFDQLKAPILRVASEDVPFPYNRNLEASVMPSVEKIVAAAKRLCEDY